MNDTNLQVNYDKYKNTGHQCNKFIQYVAPTINFSPPQCSRSQMKISRINAVQYSKGILEPTFYSRFDYIRKK